MKKQNGKKRNKIPKCKYKTFSLHYLYSLDTLLTHKERPRQKLNMFPDALIIVNVALNFQLGLVSYCNRILIIFIENISES